MEEYCTKCGIETFEGINLVLKGHKYCPECYYSVMTEMFTPDRVDDVCRGFHQNRCEDHWRRQELFEEFSGVR